MLNLIFALIGLLVGGVINWLADWLPERTEWQRPFCVHCGHVHSVRGWLAITRGRCPQCSTAPRQRALSVEVGTAVLFAALPTLVPEPRNLAVNSFHIAVLLLIIVIDLEHRLILDAVTIPATILALLGSVVVTRDENSILLSLVGALSGFMLFFIFYWVGQLLFGPGALGFGDVKLALLLGAMLGFHRIFFALILGVLLGGVGSLLLLLINRRINRTTYLPYGQYLAVAGIVMLIWGVPIFQAYVN